MLSGNVDELKAYMRELYMRDLQERMRVGGDHVRDRLRFRAQTWTKNDQLREEERVRMWVATRRAAEEQQRRRREAARKIREDRERRERASSPVGLDSERDSIPLAHRTLGDRTEGGGGGGGGGGGRGGRGDPLRV